MENKKLQLVNNHDLYILYKDHITIFFCVYPDQARLNPDNKHEWLYHHFEKDVIFTISYNEIETLSDGETTEYIYNRFVNEYNLKIESIPGASALTSALSIAGVPCADFVFLGFLPHKKGRETLFKEISVLFAKCFD
jgi:hypothetical protein